VFFPALGLHQWLARGHPCAGGIFIGVGVVMGVLGLLWPPAVKWPFVAWMIAAFPIGWLISQIMLGVMYFGLLTPVAVFFRLRGRDLLRRKPEPSATSFWTVKETPRDVRRYFTQY
jgi:hypothetical protein